MKKTTGFVALMVFVVILAVSAVAYGAASNDKMMDMHGSMEQMMSSMGQMMEQCEKMMGGNMMGMEKPEGMSQEEHASHHQ